MNQDQWEENTLQEVEEKILSTATLRTPLPQGKQGRRKREENSSPSCIEISA